MVSHSNTDKYTVSYSNTDMVNISYFYLYKNIYTYIYINAKHNPHLQVYFKYR